MTYQVTRHALPTESSEVIDGLIKVYTATDRNEESAIRIAVFDRSQIEDQVKAYSNDDADDIAAVLIGWCPTYGGPGRRFWHHVSVKIGKRYVILRQFGGLDI